MKTLGVGESVVFLRINFSLDLGSFKNRIRSVVDVMEYFEISVITNTIFKIGIAYLDSSGTCRTSCVRVKGFGRPTAWVLSFLFVSDFFLKPPDQISGHA